MIRSSAAGLRTTGGQCFTQNAIGVDASEEGDSFGTGLIESDFDADGFNDLAIAATEEDIGNTWDAGAVTILHGTNQGLNVAGAQSWHQDSPGVLGACVRHDRFGFALAGDDFNLDGYPDLAIGVPGRDVSGFNGAGAMVVLRGSNQGLRSNGARLWAQDTNGIAGTCEAGEAFGSAFDQ